MIKKKKAIFFTFIAVAIMAIAILIFTPQADVSLEKDTQSIRAKISAVNGYVDDLQSQYFETVLRALAYDSVLSLALYENSTGSFLGNFDSAFSEVILTGKINGIDIDSVTGKKIMSNNTLADWNKRISGTAKDALNVNTTIIINNVSAFQTTPWNIDAMLDVNLTVTSDVAEWRARKTIRTAFSIEGLPDPYSLVNTKSTSSYANTIKKSTVNFNQWNIGNVRESLRNSTHIYWQDSNAPSFLMRFTNTISSSGCCGIESFVNPNKLTPSDQKESYIDYLFWSHRFKDDCTQLYNVNGLWDEFSFFKLDFDDVAKYNLTQTASKTC